MLSRIVDIPCRVNFKQRWLLLLLSMVAPVLLMMVVVLEVLLLLLLVVVAKFKVARKRSVNDTIGYCGIVVYSVLMWFLHENV